MSPPDENRFKDVSSGSPPAQCVAPGLYLVATPIGNLRDITLRALDILKGCDLVLAEDTRITRRLFDAYGIATPLSAYHEHNAAAVRPKILERLAEGAAVAQVSDAGTPLVSDPGYRLALEAGEAGVPVFAAPGASAPLAALAVAGLPSDRFLFAGFLPPRQAARTKALEALKTVPATLIFFESAGRLAASLADMASVFGPRPACVARELTKAFEEKRRGPLPDLAAHYAEAGPPRGEIVVLVGPPADDAQAWDAAAVDAALAEALARGTVRDAAAEVAQASGLPKRDVYARALALKAGRRA